VKTLSLQAIEIPREAEFWRKNTPILFFEIAFPGTFSFNFFFLLPDLAVFLYQKSHICNRLGC